MRKKIFGKRLAAILLSMLMTAACAVTALGDTTKTVDNSVDKSSTRVIGTFALIECGSETPEADITVYDSEPVKVFYATPRNEYVESLVGDCEGKIERLAGALDLEEDFGYYGGAVESSSESSYDNRIYSWVNDGDDGVLIGGDDGYNPNANRHMVIDGDFARNTTIKVAGTYYKHVWDEGTVTKEATLEEEGEMTYSCICGANKTESIPVLTEEPEPGDDDKEPEPGTGDGDKEPEPGAGDGDKEPEPGAGDEDKEPVPGAADDAKDKAEPTVTPIPTEKPVVTNVPEQKGKTPQTGDTNNYLMWMAIAAAAVGVMAATFVAKKNR